MVVQEVQEETVVMEATELLLGQEARVDKRAQELWEETETMSMLVVLPVLIRELYLMIIQQMQLFLVVQMVEPVVQEVTVDVEAMVVRLALVELVEQKVQLPQLVMEE
jgi:hypothetical protein